jgi:hypothetical protein
VATTLLSGVRLEVLLTPSATVLEIGVWIAYAAGVLRLFFRPVRTAPKRPAAEVAS